MFNGGGVKAVTFYDLARKSFWQPYRLLRQKLDIIIAQGWLQRDLQEKEILGLSWGPGSFQFGTSQFLVGDQLVFSWGPSSYLGVINHFLKVQLCP